MKEGNTFSHIGWFRNQKKNGQKMDETNTEDGIKYEIFIPLV